MPASPENPSGEQAPRHGLVSHVGLILARGLQRLDDQLSPRVQQFLAGARTEFRLHPEGLRQMIPTLRHDVESLVSEYARLLGRRPRPNAEPSPPSGDLVSIQGALTRPDFPSEGAISSPPVPAGTGTKGEEEILFQAGQAAPPANYRCGECDAVITLPEKGMLPPCECGGRGWVRLE